jgi:hypothetical protein
VFALVTVRGKKEGDLELALLEAQRKIAEGHTSGGDRNETGSYTIQVSEDDDTETALQVGFSVADIISLAHTMTQPRPELSVAAAEDFLRDTRAHIEELLLERGRQLILSALAERAIQLGAGN